MHASRLVFAYLSLAPRLIQHVSRLLLVFFSLTYRLLVVRFLPASCLLLLSCSVLSGSLALQVYRPLAAPSWIDMAFVLEVVSKVPFMSLLRSF